MDQCFESRVDLQAEIFGAREHNLGRVNLQRFRNSSCFVSLAMLSGA